MDITLTGATGFIGRRLVAALAGRGHRVAVLTRTPRPGASPRYIQWDGRTPPAIDADAVIHLAGEPVAQRWTADAKQRILASRVEGTRSIVAALAAAPRKPSVLISASAIGIYGDRGDERLTESSPPGAGFLAEVTTAWEAEARKAEELGIQVATMRIGIVLGADGGALAKMLPAFRAGLGGRIGAGRQWMSWIHIDDLIGLFIHALDRPLAGPINAVSPSPAVNAEFTRELARSLSRPALFPVPEFALRLMFGEMSQVLLASQRVIPERAIKEGFRFRHETLPEALRSLWASQP